MSVVRRFAVAGLDDAARTAGRRRGLAVGAIDETGQVKQGQLTAGVKRQYLGCVGKAANGGTHVSFGTPAGTRGGRQPCAGLLLRLVNRNAATRFRWTGKMWRINGLILTTVAARSGAERTSAVGWWPGQPGPASVYCFTSI